MYKTYLANVETYLANVDPLRNPPNRKRRPAKLEFMSWRPRNNKRRSMIKKTPPLGIEPRTCRLTADRSANGALEAHIAGTRAHYPSEIWAQFPPFGQKVPRPGFEPGSRG